MNNRIKNLYKIKTFSKAIQFSFEVLVICIAICTIQPLLLFPITLKRHLATISNNMKTQLMLLPVKPCNQLHLVNIVIQHHDSNPCNMT